MVTRAMEVSVTDEWKAERVRLATDAINALIAFTAHEQHVAQALTGAAQLLGSIINDPDWQPYTESEDDEAPPFTEAQNERYREILKTQAQRRAAGRCPICNRLGCDPDAPFNPADVDYDYFTGIDCPNCGGDVVQFI